VFETKRETRTGVFMTLELKNIGMIKEASVKIDGLTVIAGENDTGKSTVGKELFKEVREYIICNKISNKLILDKDEKINLPIFIDTPDLLAKFNYIKNTSVLLQQNKLNFELPIEVTDLILRISQDKVKKRNISEFQLIKNIISGEIFYNPSKDDIFYKKVIQDKKTIILPMSKTSSGIKMFGYFQMLILNKSIQENTVLILDEPEVHLHPKWQLKMAEFIIRLIKINKVKVLVNSHSPYMIEALKRYSEVEEIEEKTNFYLAEGGYIEHQDSLENIFEKLTFPLRELKKLKMEKYLND